MGKFILFLVIWAVFTGIFLYVGVTFLDMFQMAEHFNFDVRHAGALGLISALSQLNQINEVD